MNKKSKMMCVSVVAVILAVLILWPFFSRLRETNAYAASQTEPFVSEGTFDEDLHAFSVRLTQTLLDKNGTKDFCVSPVSVYVGLTTLSCGADEKLTELLSDALGDVSPKKCGAYAAWLSSQDSCNMGTALVMGTDTKTDSNFSKEAEESGAVVLKAGAKSVRRWAKKLGYDAKAYTPNEDPQGLDILNVITCAFTWKTPMLTGEELVFYREDGTQTTVPSMFLDCTSLGYLETEQYTRVILPLNEGDLFVLLPAEGYTVRDIDLKEAVPAPSETYAVQNIDIVLPKYELDGENELNDALCELGLAELFENGALDSIGENMYLKGAAQSYSFGMNELGVKAAAMTREMIYTAANVPEVICDHPFLYGIRDEGGRILFVGVCAME